MLESKTWFPKEQSDSFTASFCIPVIFKTKENREKAIKEFQENNIEVRPLICGGMNHQPMFIKRYGKIKLPNVDKIFEIGIYVPNHPHLELCDIKRICDIIIKNDQ